MKWDVLKHGLTNSAAYDASVQDYYENLQKQYERAKRQQDMYEKQKREYERQRKKADEKKAKEERDRKAYLEKLKSQTPTEEREKAAVRAQEAWGKGETPAQRDSDLFEVSDYRKALATGDNQEWYEKAWRKVKDFFLSADGITATGWKMNDIQASQFSGNIAISREDQLLLGMAEDYFKGNKTPENRKAIQELNKRKPGLLNSAAVYANKALNWVGNNSITGTTGAFLGTNELDKVRIGIDFDENTTSEQALQNIESLRNAYKAFDEESYNAYLENHNKAKYYENLLNDDYKRRLNIAEGRIPNENGVTDGSVDFFNFSKLRYQLPGIIAGSISSPSQLVSSFATGIGTGIKIGATATAATAAIVGTGGWGAVAVPGMLSLAGAGATFGLNQAQGGHENAAEVDEGYISKVKYALDRHPGAAVDFYNTARSILGKGATEDEIITAALAHKVPILNRTIEKAFNDASMGNQRQYDRDMVATTLDSTIDTALQITPLKFFSTLGKSALKANLRSSRIARAANKIGEGLDKISGGSEGALRKAFSKTGALVSGKGALIGGAIGATLDNIPKANMALKSMVQFDLAKIRKWGPKATLWSNYAGAIIGRGIRSAISEGIEEGKQYYNQQKALQEFQNGLRNGNLSYDTQNILGDLLDDFQAGDFAASGMVQAMTGIPMLDALHWTDENIIDVAEAIRNIKSGMIGGHGQTTFMTAATGLGQTIGTSGVIDDMELAIRALQDKKLSTQRQFAQDEIFSKTKSRYIDQAIKYLRDTKGTNLSDEELNALRDRAVEVRGISESPQMKALARELEIPKEDYHKFVADYMYHKDNLEAERENKRGAYNDLTAKANEIEAAGHKIANPSDEISEKWVKDDLLSESRAFESEKNTRINKLQNDLKTLKDKLEKKALTRSQKAETQAQIDNIEEQIKKEEESKFDDSKKISYAQSRFDRINVLASIRGTMKQLQFLNTMLQSMGDSNISGKRFFEGQIKETKKLLNSQLAGNKLRGRQLTADRLDWINEWANLIATQIEQADQDNPNLMGPSAELSSQIESLAQAYQEYSKAVLNYNIVGSLFNDFIGYNVNDKNEIVRGNPEGSRHVKGNAKEHLDGIISAWDDDAKLEQAYKQGFASYGFKGVYKDDSPLVQDQEREEEEANPGTTERRSRIKELGNSIRDFMQRSKNYVTGKWKNFGFKRVFVPDESRSDEQLDPSETQLNAQEYYNKIVEDYKASDDLEKWLDSPSIDVDKESDIVSNAHLLVNAYLSTKSLSNDIIPAYGDIDDRVVDIYYKGTKIGTITPMVSSNKARGDSQNEVAFFAEGFDLDKITDAEYLESLIKPDTSSTGEPGGTSGETSFTRPADITSEQEAVINVLKDLEQKMNEKFDVSLRTSSHYFEWVGTGENRKLRLWHRLHDEIGSHIKTKDINRKNWSKRIKELYRIVYHKGYENETSAGIKDIQALLDRLQHFYEDARSNEQTLERISGYIAYLKQEGDNISNADLYECLKGIAEEMVYEVLDESDNRSIDRGTATDILCRNILGTHFNTPEEALEFCKDLSMTNKSGADVFIRDYFTESGFEDFVKHLWNTRRVYVEELGYTLWTAPFTIYTEDFTNEDGSNIRIAGEIDMLAIDKDGNSIIIDYKTSKNAFFENGELSTNFTTVGKKYNRSPQEQYTNQQSAYIQMLNETSRKETTLAGGFNCKEARLLPIHLIESLTDSKHVNKVDIEFSKDQQLSLQTVPFKTLGEKEGLIFDKEKFRAKLSKLSELYARVDYFAERLNVYHNHIKNRTLVNQIKDIRESLDSIYLSLQEITLKDLEDYENKINDYLSRLQGWYFGSKDMIDQVFEKYGPGQLVLDEEDKASKYNNLDWKSPLNDNDIDKLGGFDAMGVKDRKEYDEKVEELAHVSCNSDFQRNASAKLTAVTYKTRQGNDKIAVYATITYKDTTYPPIRLYLAKNTGEQFAKDVLEGNTFGGNIQTTIGLLSKCSDGKQHRIGENKLLIDAIGGTEENPYGNFIVDSRNNQNVAVVTYNKSTGVLSTVSTSSNGQVVALPKTLKESSANGHIIINVTPENSNAGSLIPIVCNTPKINSTLGVDRENHRRGSLLDFIVFDVLQQLNNVEGGDPLNAKYFSEEYGEIPLTFEQILNLFFEKYDPNNGTLVERPQYRILPGRNSRMIQIGNFSDSLPSISLDDTESLKKAISGLSVWISTQMAGVKWDSSKPGSDQFNDFAKFLREKLKDGEKFYLGESSIYFDKTDADGTYLGFLAKNGLLTTPFNGFSHPLISINSCQKEDAPLSPGLGEDEQIPKAPKQPGQKPGKPKNKRPEGYDSLPEDQKAMIDIFDPSFFSNEEDVDETAATFHFQKGRSKLDQAAARKYIERVLGKSFADKHLEFVEEISSAIVGGLSAGTIIAGQVTANMMKLSRYAENGTEYHEAFHWAFELIMDPSDSRRIRNFVRKKYNLSDEREIAEWLAEAYTRYVGNIYTPKSTLLQKAFNKIKQWGITFASMFTGDYQLYKVFNSIHNGNFANDVVNNDAVLRFQEKFKELNSKVPTKGFEKNGLEYKYIQGPVDYDNKIESIAFLALSRSSTSPALNYAKNQSITINVQDAKESNYAKQMMMDEHYVGKKHNRGFTTEQLQNARKNSVMKDRWSIIDQALSLRELLDDDHIDETQKQVSAYIDRLIGVKGKDLSVDIKDDGSEEAAFDDSYMAVENGEPSEAGGNREHLIPDHQISRMSKTSSRIKLFFGTIPIMKFNEKAGRYLYAPNRFGYLGYYPLHEIYQAIQNRYHHVLSPEALWNAIENDAQSNATLYSLHWQISGIRKLASKGNNNAIGLLNEIYKNIKSTKQSEEVTKTRYDSYLGGVTYSPENIMVKNNSYAISRDFTDIVFGSFNKFFRQKAFKDDDGKETWGIEVRNKIYNERTGNEDLDSYYREVAFTSFFGDILWKVDVVEIDGDGKEKIVQKNMRSIYNVIASYGTRNQYPFYLRDERYKDSIVYREASLEQNLLHIKFRLVEALGAIGIDVTIDQIDDILETQFGGTGILQLQRLLTQEFSLPDSRSPSKVGNKVTLQGLANAQDTKIVAALSNGDGIIKVRKENTINDVITKDDRSIFRNQPIHVLMSTLLAIAQQAKYEVSGRGVDGKLSYAMTDDNTVTAMCDVIFDKTGDTQCSKIRQMIINDPFNISDSGSEFGNMRVGSFILPQINNEIARIEKVKAHLDELLEKLENTTDENSQSALRDEISDVEQQLEELTNNPSYEVVNDGGIETGNKENSSTNSEKRGADTIVGTIVKLCQNMIVIAPFADKSTGLSIRLNGIKLPGLDYSQVTYEFKTNKKDERDAKREDNVSKAFKMRVGAIDVDATGRVQLSNRDDALDRTIAGYVLAEYYQAKKAIQDYEDLLRNHAAEDNNTDVEEKYKTAFNICKKLMFMSQFSGDYVQVKNEKTKQWEWTFRPFNVKNGANKSDLAAAKEMLSQFEQLVYDNATNSFSQELLLQFVNRHINGLMDHELKRLQEFGIITRSKVTEYTPNPRYHNELLDRNIIMNIRSGIYYKNIMNDTDTDDYELYGEQAIRIFMYDIIGKSIISKQESERLFTGQSDLYEIVRDSDTRIITVPYQDQAKRIGSFASTGSVGAIEDEDYTCAEIKDDKQAIQDQVERSIYMNEIANCIKTGHLNMDDHPDFDTRSATNQQLYELIPKEFRPLVDTKVKNAMKGFVTQKKDGSENKNNVTDGAAFISSEFAEKLLRQQGAWNNEIAQAFKKLNSEEKQDINDILNSYETFSRVWTEVIGMYKYTAVGFRTENVNGQEKVIPYVDKYALAPVFACICNDKMDAIRKQMKKQGVDVLMFESCVKVGAHGNSNFSVDNFGEVSGEFNTYTQKSFFLRKQLNTDPNEKEIMKIGIQTVKVALSAVIGEDGIEFQGQKMSGDEIIDKVMADIDALTEARKAKLMSKLNTESKVVDYVANFLRGNNVPEKVIEAFKNGAPAEALGIQKHVDTLSAKRIQEDIVRINSPGSAFIQRCVYGVEGPGVKFGALELNDGDELNVINSDGSMDCVLSVDYYVEYKYDKKYKTHVPYFKLTPKGQKRIKLTIKDPKTGEERPMSFEEIRQWLKDNNVIGKNSKASILSYRIPTQAVASINALKCVDVIPVVRDTVILPKLFTTITGADFDIDKLFMSTVWYSMEQQKDGSYKPHQLELDRSKEGLKNATEEQLSNAVVNDYIDVLCATAKEHPEIFYMSIDQDTKLADDVISWIKSLNPQTEEDKLSNASGILHSMPSMQAKVHDEFLAGRQGIGPFALALVNHVLTRIYNVSFNSKGVYLSHRSLSNNIDDDGKSIMAWLSAMINKHVDVAKNPDITYLNVNDSTFNVVALLLRLGYGRRTFMFTCQDIMRDYAFGINQEKAVCKYSKNDNDYVNARQQAYDSMIEKYGLGDVVSMMEDKKISETDIQIAACREIFDRDIEDGGKVKPLLQYVLEHHGSVPKGMTIKIGTEIFQLTDTLLQYLNLQLFNYLSDKMAAPLTSLQQASVIDNERCITSMIQSEFYKQSVEKVRQLKIFKNADKLLDLSYITKKIDAVMDAMSAIYNGASCMDKLVVTTVAKAIDPKILSYGRKRMLSFLSTVRDGMVAYYGSKFFDEYCKNNNIDVKSLLKTYTGNKNSIVRRLSSIQASTRGSRGKYKALRGNLLLKGLSIEGIVGEQYIDNGKPFTNKHRFMNYEFLKFKYAGQSDDNILADVQQAWQELFDYPDETVQNFARDLVVYAFYTSGEMSGNTKLFKYVPVQWRIDSGYVNYFKKVKANRNKQYEDIDDIIDKLCRNLWYKEQFVKKIGIKTLLRFKGASELMQHTRTIFSDAYEDGSRSVLDPVAPPVIAGIQYNNKTGKAHIMFEGDKDQCPRYIKCYDSHHDPLTINDDDSTSWVLYKLIGFNQYVDANQKHWDYPVYVQTSTLGEKYFKNNVFEYNEEIEENTNLDAHKVIETILSRINGHKLLGSDINDMIEGLTGILDLVNLSVYSTTDSIIENTTQAAEESIDILVDRQNSVLAFTPLKTQQEYLEEKRKMIEAQEKAFCGRK